MSEVTADAPPTAACVRCTNPLQAGAAFCRLCGAPVSGRVIAPPEPPLPAGMSPEGDDSRSFLDRPSPAAADFDGVRPADAVVRVAAWLVDAATVVVTVFLVAVLAHVTDTPAVLLVTGPVAVVALWTWSIVWHAMTGTSFGKAALGIRLVSSRDLTAPGLSSAIVRSSVVLASVGTVFVSIALDGSGWRRGWHDTLGSTVVIDVVNGRNPLGEQVVTAVLRRPDRGLRSIDSPVPLRTVGVRPAPPPPPSSPTVES